MNNSLKLYRSKRDFTKTPEPEGITEREFEDPIFVIQKHAASHLHYDFRLEANGVLKSWAIPKGPSTNPKDKRLAVLVEDHPLEYATFEGVIPEGQYGAGTVMLWDIGTYKNLKKLSFEQCLKEGHIEVWLEGKVLRGAYALVRMRKTALKEHWLLIKMHDAYENQPPDPVTSYKRSVLSGRTMAQIRSQS